MGLLFLLGACAGTPTPVADASCPAAFAPIVTARVEPGAIVRNDISMAAMREDAARVTEAAQAGGPGSAHQKLLRHYFGQSLTKTRLDARLHAEELSRGALSCAVPHRIDLVLGFVRREVRVATETHADPCLRREVETHEMRHVQLDDALLAAYRPILDARARALAQELQPTGGASYEEALGRLSARLRAEIRSIYEAFETARHRRHRAEIDTPEEYARVRTMCEGRARELVAARQ